GAAGTARAAAPRAAAPRTAAAWAGPAPFDDEAT
ncbi:tyrosinase, partial [Cellulomonas shaoxiangyii]